MPDLLMRLYIWSRWPLVFFVVHLAVSLLYLAAGVFPDGTTLRQRWFSPGSVLATVLWVLVTWAYGFYVGDVVDLGATYGSMAGAVGLLFYLWLVYGMLMLAGQLERARGVQRLKEATPARPAPAAR